MNEITWRETDREEALRLYAQGVPMSYFYDGEYLRAICPPKEYENALFTGFRVDANFSKPLSSNKIVRYDFLDNSLAPTNASPDFETEAHALEALRDYTDDGVAEDDEYIIYKITYEPVKRLRVKINTTLEEIQ